NRQNTMAELEYLRDTGYPYLMQRLNRMEVLMNSWSERSEENKRRARDDLFGVQNSRKARVGGLAGLLDPKLMARKVAEEDRLKKFIEKSMQTEVHEAGKAFDTVAACEKTRAKIIRDTTLLENAGGFSSHLFQIARTLVRAADEKPKPSGDRLREFG